MAQPQSPDKKFPYETIEEIEMKQIPSPDHTEKKRTAVEKLGAYNIVVLTIGTLIILLGIGFLAFVWAISINNATQLLHLPRLWRLIVANKWVSRVVTLCSILIRVATAAQLCVFAAIMAALILERVGASTEDLPLLSMMRCANTGPQALIWNVLRTLKTGQQMGYSFLIVLTILNALALQFTSTILLADLGPIEVVMESHKKMDVHFGLSEMAALNPYVGVDFWKTGPQVYQRFAEHKGPASIGTNFADTGKTYRGFLPFGMPQDRDNLRFYTGPMEVFDSRVLCVAPKLSNLSIWPYSDANDTDHVISGTMDISGIHPDLTTKQRSAHPKDPDYVLSDFNCSVPAVNFHGSVGNASICILTMQYAQLLNGIIPEDADEEEYPMGKTLPHLVINATSVHDDYLTLSPNRSTLKQLPTTTDSWAKFGNKNMTFDLSLCFVRPASRAYDITAWSEESWMDATNQWDNSTGELSLDTTWVREMLDATGRNYTPAERGLLTIDPPSNWSAAQTRLLHEVPALSFIFESLIVGKSESDSASDPDIGSTYLLTPWVMPQNAMHRSHAILASHILQNTSNPAVAMQSVWTVLLQMAYYDFYGDYSLHTEAEVGVSEIFTIPYKWNCFAGVMGLLALHFVLLVLGLVLFLTKTEMSLLGNSWQAIAQVMSTDTANTIHHSKNATDNEVNKTVKTASEGEERMRITRCTTSGRTEAVSVLRRRREDGSQA